MERLFYMLTDGDTGTVRAWMDKFMATGSLTLPPPYTPQLWATAPAGTYSAWKVRALGVGVPRA